jgi:hypothetical protein
MIPTATIDPDPRRLRRNDIVMERKDEFFSPFGRVIERIDPDHVRVICCTKHDTIHRDTDLHRVIYKGMWDTKFDPEQDGRVETHFRSMPSLRRLKQMRSYYDKRVWRRSKGRFRIALYPIFGADSIGVEQGHEIFVSPSLDPGRGGYRYRLTRLANRLGVSFPGSISNVDLLGSIRVAALRVAERDQK